MTSPRFLKLDPDLFRRLPALRKAAAALAAYREWQPEASLLEAAAALGIPESTARRWSAYLAEDAAGATDGATDGATGGATGGALSIDSEIRRGEGEANGPPAPLVSRIQNETDEAAAVILAAAYIARSTRRRVTTAETHGRILEDFTAGLYAPRDLARYLEARPHCDVYPSQFHTAVATYLNHVNVRRAKAKELAAWSALRRRLASITPGDTAWPVAEPSGVPWTVVEVDAEAGRVTFRRRTSADAIYAGFAGPPELAAIFAEKNRQAQGRVDEQTLTGPDALADWTFESETMPLWASANRPETPSGTDAHAGKTGNAP